MKINRSKTYEQLTPEERNHIGDLQDSIRRYLSKHPERKAPNARRIGLTCVEPEKAIELGCSNFYELCTMAQLAEEALVHEDTTALDYTYHLNDRGTDITKTCTEEQHQIESSIITWLGSNVGRDFIRQAFAKAGIDVNLP